jgi:hypothetical protein
MPSSPGSGRANDPRSPEAATGPGTRGGWWRRNALILLPAALFSAYVGWYALCFPLLRTTSGGAYSVRVCSYGWQVPLWRPLAWAEQQARGRTILAHRGALIYGDSPLTIGDMARYPDYFGLERVW